MMTDQYHKLHSITITHGNIKEISAECEQLNIRGSAAIHQEIHFKKISTHGYSSFHSHVSADVLKNTGTCVLKDNCEFKEIVNAGHLKMINGQSTSIRSSGSLTVEQTLHTEHLDSIGMLKAKEIQAKHFRLRLSGISKIERLIAEEVCIEKDRISFSLFKKKLFCKYMSGGNLILSNTEAEIVEGDFVVIGENCNIQTLYYKEDYKISPNAKVQQIVRSQK